VAVSVGVNRSFEPFVTVAGSTGSRRKVGVASSGAQGSVCVVAPSANSSVAWHFDPKFNDLRHLVSARFARSRAGGGCL